MTALADLSANVYKASGFVSKAELMACIRRIRHTKWFETLCRVPFWGRTDLGSYDLSVSLACFSRSLLRWLRGTGHWSWEGDMLTLCWAWSSLPGTTSSWDMGRSLGRQMPWAKLPKSYKKTATSSNNLYHYSTADTSRTSASGRWQNGSANSTPCYKVWPTIVLVVCNILRMFSLSPKW